jgi:hypothetical protein
MKYKKADGAFTVPISDNEANEYIKARSVYDYPKAFVEITSPGLHDIQLSDSVFCRFVTPSTSQRTDLLLDQYHYELLRSDIPVDRLLGLASVVYWGYFKFGDAYARNKVDWLINGSRTSPATTSKSAFAHTTSAIFHLNRLCMADALSSLHGLSQLGQTPFSSKVIAFMAPSVAGVYDNRIANGLLSSTWSTTLSVGIGQTKSSRVKNCYQSWCLYLSQVASQLNLGISLGKAWQWSCGDDKKQHWRALDVERALFALYNKTASGFNVQIPEGVLTVETEEQFVAK